jgi:hypothetical protein
MEVAKHIPDYKHHGGRYVDKTQKFEHYLEIHELDRAYQRLMKYNYIPG